MRPFTPRSAFFALLALAAGIQAVITEAEIAEKSAQGLSLLQLGDGAEPIWVTETQKLSLIAADVRFVSGASTWTQGRTWR